MRLFIAEMALFMVWPALLGLLSMSLSMISRTCFRDTLRNFLVNASDKQPRFLQKRGRLPKGSMLPAHPRRLVAESDAQEVTELVGKDGLVQKVSLLAAPRQ